MMPEPAVAETLVELLRLRAGERPDHPVYIFFAEGAVETGRMTYRELERQARACAAKLQQVGAADERVLLLLPSGLDFMVAFFGCLYAGAVAVPCFPPRPNRPAPRIQAIAVDAQARFAITTPDVISNLEKRFAYLPDLKALTWLNINECFRTPEDYRENSRITPESLIFLQYTSGSTASPKGVMVNHRNILANTEMLQAAYRTGRETVIVSWLPLFHDMGLIGATLHPIWIGGTHVMLSPEAFLHSPLLWLQAFTRYRGTFTGAPNFAYDLCAEKIPAAQRESLDLRAWNCASVGAEPVRPATMRKFVAAFEPCGFRLGVLNPSYGLAEGTLMVTSCPFGSDPVVTAFDKKLLETKRVRVAGGQSEATVDLVSCGQAVGQEKVVIVDPETCAPCAPDEVGEIWISGPNVTGGYWNRPEETCATFQARLAGSGEGPFLRSGDLGFFHAGGLHIAGRLKDLIIIEGLNYYPQDIELSVEQCHAALRPNSGAAFSVAGDGGERLVVVQEVERVQRKNLDAEEIMTAIRWAVARDHGLRAHAVVLVEPLSIPKTTSGKIMRRACQQMFRDGALKTIAAWQAPA